MEEKPRIKSIEKTFNILECFTLENSHLGITEISNKLGLYKSNVYNILVTLESMGYVEQDSNTSKYFLGRNFIKLSNVAMSAAGYNSSIREGLRYLSKVIDETIYYGVPDGSNIIYLDGAYPDTSYNTTVIVGVTAPLACTGIGKAVLAYKDEDYINEVLSQPIHKFTDYTITDKNEMLKELALTNERGYSIDNMEHEYGVKCVGVPVFNRYNEIIAGISASGPSLRFDKKRVAEIAEIMIKVSKELSEKIE